MHGTALDAVYVLMCCAAVLVCVAIEAMKRIVPIVVGVAEDEKEPLVWEGDCDCDFL